MEEKIRVIVPVHNAEETIDRCVESLVGQTYKNIEIILVENGSVDKSYEKCAAWAAKDERIRLLRSEKGVSKARNAGLDITGGIIISHSSTPTIM